MKNKKKSFSCLFLHVSFLIVLHGCYVDGKEGKYGNSGDVFVTFYLSDDINYVNRLNITFNYNSRRYYNGNDNVQSNYNQVNNYTGNFTWRTNDNQTYNQTIHFTPNPGEKGRDTPSAIGWGPNTEAQPAIVGKSGLDKFMVISLNGENATYFDNTCKDAFPDNSADSCPAHSINSVTVNRNGTVIRNNATVNH